MITTETSRQLLQRLYVASKEGNVAGILEMMAQDIVAEVPEVLPFGGRFEGLERFVANISVLATEWLDFTTLEIHSLLADGNQVVAEVSVDLVGGAGRVQISEHWTLNGEGKIARVKIYYFDPRPVLEKPVR